MDGTKVDIDPKTVSWLLGCLNVAHEETRNAEIRDLIALREQATAKLLLELDTERRLSSDLSKKLEALQKHTDAVNKAFNEQADKLEAMVNAATIATSEILHLKEARDHAQAMALKYCEAAEKLQAQRLRWRKK